METISTMNLLTMDLFVLSNKFHTSQLILSIYIIVPYNFI